MTSDGTVYANATHLGIDETKPLSHIRAAGKVFVGVRLSDCEMKKLLAVADNALVDTVAKIAFKRSRWGKNK